MKTTRRPVLGASLAILALTGATVAWAQGDYPAKPIRFVVPNLPGGSSDILARMIGDRMGRSMGQSVVVDNRAGAGGSVGTAEVARAAPDGYTILMGTSSSHAINQAVYPNLKYNVVKDFSLITTVALSEYALSVPSSSPFRSVQDLLKANSKDKALRYASNGNGSTTHLAAALLGMKTGNEFIHVPYKSSSAAMTDLMGGQVDFAIDNTAAAQQNATTGKIRVLATTGAVRAPSSKDIPTMREAGVADYEVIGWWVIAAPAGTPPAIVERLNKEIAKAVNEPDVKKKMEEMGNPPFLKTPAETTAFVTSEVAKFKTIADAIHLRLD